MTTAEILKQARALIDTPDKWVQGVWGEGDSYCALGAVSKSIRGTPHWTAFTSPQVTGPFEGATKALREALPKKWVEFCGDSVIRYNDAKTRTHKQVMAWFDRAIKIAEKEDADAVT